MNGSGGAVPFPPDDPRGPPVRIRQGADRFAGRLWALDQVLTWLDSGTTRFLVLEGEPGAGKSVLAAWMVGFGRAPEDPAAHEKLERVRRAWSARHFCQSKAGGTVEPQRFAGSICTQLTDRYADFGQAAIKYVAPDFNIRVEARENWGAMIGVKTDTLIVNSRDAADVYDKAVRRPLQDLVRSHPDLFPIVMLIDGLDEAWAHPEPNIVTLLADSEDLPEKVRMVVTTRNQPALVERLKRRTTLDLSAPGHAAVNDQDMREYLTARFGSEPLSEKVETPPNAQDVIEGLVTRAGGNFLFVEFVLDEVAAGRRSLTDPSSAPAGLYPLYREYLDRLLPGVTAPGGSDVWLKEFQPLLGSISVALPAAPEKALPGWLAWEPDEVDARRNDVYQLTEEVADLADNESGYSVYHRSLGEFFASREYLDEGESTRNRYYVGPKKQHERIARYYLSLAGGAHPDWTKVDLYALRQLVPHLRAWLDLAEDSQEQQEAADLLYGVVIDGRFVDEQQRRLKGVEYVRLGLRLALDAALGRRDLEAAEQMITLLSRSLDVDLRTAARLATQQLQALDPARFQRLTKSLLP